MGNAGTKIKVLSAENQQLSKILHSSPTTRWVKGDGGGGGWGGGETKGIVPLLSRCTLKLDIYVLWIF